MSTPSKKDYYQILGVSKDASPEEIKKAFRGKARTMHPDICKEEGAEERFKEISEAYDTLSDPDKRARYDMVREGGFSTQMPYGAGGYSRSGAGGYDPFGWGWGSPFTGGYANSYGKESSNSVPYGRKEGATRKIMLQLTRDEARKGCTKKVSFNRQESCPTCQGRGHDPENGPRTCGVCNGTGQVQANMAGLFMANVHCPACSGSGKVIDTPCTACHGSGTHQTRATVEVVIPASSHDGDVVRIPGAGDAGRCGGASGDFQVEMHVPSDRLTQQQETAFTAAGVIASVVLCTFFGPLVMNLLSWLAPLCVILFLFAWPSLIRTKPGGSFAERAVKRILKGMVIGLFVYVIFVPVLF